MILFCIHFTQNFMLISNLYFLWFSSIYWEILALKVWPKSRLLGKIRHGYGLFGHNRFFLVKATQGRYWAAMLGSMVVGAFMFWSQPLMLVRYSFRHQVQAGQFYSGPELLYYYNCLFRYRETVFFTK